MIESIVSSHELSEECTQLFAFDAFFFQLSICIERKQQQNEEYQDCVGSEDVESTVIVSFSPTLLAGPLNFRLRI